MVATSYEASAPGSLMLLGEYAVTEGYPAVVSTIDKCIRVNLIPRKDNTISIVSELGHYETTLDNLMSVPPFDFVLTALQLFKPYLTRGFELQIHSEFEIGIGLSSSAAVTVAVIRVVCAFLNLATDKNFLLKQAISVVRSVQGAGSGADVAASIYGGVIAYQSDRVIREFPSIPNLFSVYSGVKNKTSDALAQFKKARASNKNYYEEILQKIGQLAEVALPTIEEKDWVSLGRLFTQSQKYMCALGVSTPLLNALIEKYEANPGVLGVKISGSGFGDCIVGLGASLCQS